MRRVSQRKRLSARKNLVRARRVRVTRPSVNRPPKAPA